MPHPAIDIHTHAFPDALAERAIDALEKDCPWQAVGDGTVAGLVASMDAAGVAKSAVLTIATRSGQAEGILRWCEAIRSDRILPFPSVHPDAPHAERWIERIAAGGFKGIKLHPMFQRFAIDEPRVDRLYAACRDAGLVIAFHCGCDITFPPDDDRASAERLARMLGRTPRLRVIASHMGGWRAWDEAERYLVGRPDLWLETSFSLDSLGPERALRMIRDHGVERVMFGTDWPWRRQDADLEMLGALGLTDEELQAVRGGNAAKLLGV